MATLSWQVKALSKNFLKTTADLALFLTAFGIGVTSEGYSSRGVHRAANWAEGVSYDSLRRALQHGRARGWIKRDLTVSREGQKRLAALLPQPRKYPKRWSGMWHLISFDIPRTLNYKRNQLREVLKKLGFGKLHESLWIHPWSFLGDVIQWAETAKVAHHILPATSKELGREHSQTLAEKVWKLKELDLRYVNWLGAMAQSKKSKEELFFGYLDIIQDDPFLPLTLIRENFYGPRAHALARKEFPTLFQKLEEGFKDG